MRKGYTTLCMLIYFQTDISILYRVMLVYNKGCFGSWSRIRRDKIVDRKIGSGCSEKRFWILSNKMQIKRFVFQVSGSGNWIWVFIHIAGQTYLIYYGESPDIHLVQLHTRYIIDFNVCKKFLVERNEVYYCVCVYFSCFSFF